MARQRILTFVVLSLVTTFPAWAMTPRQGSLEGPVSGPSAKCTSCITVFLYGDPMGKVCGEHYFRDENRIQGCRRSLRKAMRAAHAHYPAGAGYEWQPIRCQCTQRPTSRNPRALPSSK